MITADFWKTLSGLRACSRRILVALEEGDLDELERLSRESEETLAVLKPVLEERMAHPEHNEDDIRLAEMVDDLKLMNERIVEELEIGKQQIANEIGEVRENRLRLVQYRDAALAKEPQLVDLDG